MPYKVPGQGSRTRPSTKASQVRVPPCIPCPVHHPLHPAIVPAPNFQVPVRADGAQAQEEPSDPRRTTTTTYSYRHQHLIFAAALYRGTRGFIAPLSVWAVPASSSPLQPVTHIHTRLQTSITVRTEVQVRCRWSPAEHRPTQPTAPHPRIVLKPLDRWQQIHLSSYASHPAYIHHIPHHTAASHALRTARSLKEELSKVRADRVPTAPPTINSHHCKLLQACRRQEAGGRLAAEASCRAGQRSILRYCLFCTRRCRSDASPANLGAAHRHRRLRLW